MSTSGNKKQGMGRGCWLAIGGVLIVGAILIAVIASVFMQGNSTAQAPATVAVQRGDIVALVAGSGTVGAAKTLDLPFKTGGSVVEVLVEEGDVVAVGDPLARLDDRELQLQLTNAEAGLTSAKARLAQAKEGNTTPESIASAQASLDSAEAQLVKARTGNITAADIANSEAALRSAQAKLDDLLAGPKPEQVSAARAKLEQAQANLEKAKKGPDESQVISARAKLANAEAAVQQAQAAYDQVKWRNDIGALPQSADLQQATNNYVEAKASYDELMKGPDPEDVAIAESQVRDAEEQLRVTLEGATQAEIIQARAAVDQARANLDKLRQGGTEADIAVAQAAVDQARANLDKLTAPASATDISVQEAAVAQAEQSLKQAQFNLENAVLKAPFAGIVTAVTIVPGSVVGTNNAAVSLMDRSTLHVDLKLSENDVAQAALGQRVTLSIDSLQDWHAEGEVSYIAPAAEITNDVVTYQVRVSFPDSDPQVKVGMTANIDITTAEKTDVVLVPNTALLPKGAGRVVRVVGPDGITTEEREVTIGLNDGVYSEVLSGLEGGEQIVALPNSGTRRSGGLFGGPP